jgi:hypothetical protein
LYFRRRLWHCSARRLLLRQLNVETKRFSIEVG